MSLAHVSRDMRMLGYLAKENRVCLIDGKKQIVTYELLTSVLNYQTAVVREDFDAAHKILQSVPPSKYDQIAQFLTSQGFKEQALQVAVDPDLKFELAIELGKLDLAHGIIVALPEAELNTTPTQHKWKQLGDLALASCNLALAAKCSKASGDLAGQLIMLSSSGDSEGLLSLGNEAKMRGRFNIAFLCFFLLHRINDCLDLLLEAGRTPEAAFLARTYSPSRVSEMVGLWRQNLEKISKRAAESLADPSECVLHEYFVRQLFSSVFAGAHSLCHDCALVFFYSYPCGVVRLNADMPTFSRILQLPLMLRQVLSKTSQHKDFLLHRRTAPGHLQSVSGPI